MKIIKRNIGALPLYYLPNKKFKTIDVAFVFTNQYVDQELNERQFLTEILLDTTKKYNNSEKMSLVSDNLFGLDKVCNFHVSGEVAITTFLVRFINEKYLDGEKVTEKALELLMEIIYNPKLYKGKIPLVTVKDQLEQVEQMLMSIKQNKNAYAYYQFMHEYTKKDQEKVGIFPNLPYLDKISQASLTSVYDKLINEDSLQVFIAGDFNHQEMDELIMRKLSRINFQETKKLNFQPDYQKVTEVNKIIEKNSSGQTRIFMGYYLPFPLNKKNANIMNIFDELFGGFEKSKLFVTIREKLNLSYYVYSRYNEDNNLFFVGLETSKENNDSAIDAVNNQLELCIKGEIDDELFEQAKQNLIKRLEAKMDTQIAMLLHNVIHYLKYRSYFDLNNQIEQIKAITKTDVIRLIKKIELDTVYIYTNGDE